MATVHETIQAVNAYAESQKQYTSDRAYLAVVHRRSKGSEADTARRIRDAASEALNAILEWPELIHMENGDCVLQSPDGTQVLYFCEHMHGRTFEYLRLLEPTETTTEHGRDEHHDTVPRHPLRSN